MLLFTSCTSILFATSTYLYVYIDKLHSVTLRTLYVTDCLNTIYKTLSFAMLYFPILQEIPESFHLDRFYSLYIMLKSVGNIFFFVNDFHKAGISLLYMKHLLKNCITNLTTKYYRRNYRIKLLVSF